MPASSRLDPEGDGEDGERGPVLRVRGVVRWRRRQGQGGECRPLARAPVPLPFRRLPGFAAALPALPPGNKVTRVRF